MTAPLDPAHLPPFGFDNSYARLGEAFYTRLTPEPVRAPRLIAYNAPLAERLGLPTGLGAPELAPLWAGNHVPKGAAALAMVYAGHQFGGFSPRLGDGRAWLMGEVIAPDGARFDIQLKGSGPTPYSRRGDGRAALGPVLREFLISEAMAALELPTTRSLAAVTTGETVYRETAQPGAVLTRIAASHIRVGSFEYFAARGEHDHVRALAEHAIARHDPDLEGTPDRFIAFLDRVVARQADLVARWLGIGFIHGVMNTDNCAISGETIDYGPCAFMDGFHPARVFSSIDHQGRYAYGNQARMAFWNLARLAEALLPLLGPDPQAALARAQARVERFADLFQAAWLKVLRAKLGLGALAEVTPAQDMALAQEFLDLLGAREADFTNSFAALFDLASGRAGADSLEQQIGASADLTDWLARWQDRRALVRAEDRGAALETMRAANPVVIARNHRVDAALKAAERGDYTLFERLRQILASPHALASADAEFAKPPEPEEAILATFCGT
ncbi:MAG: YdiU family protein [Neomegalonema sp.]|nr:YdiU family protein [Neomegalonema sp.]